MKGLIGANCIKFFRRWSQGFIFIFGCCNIFWQYSWYQQVLCMPLFMISGEIASSTLHLYFTKKEKKNPTYLFSCRLPSCVIVCYPLKKKKKRRQISLELAWGISSCFFAKGDASPHTQTYIIGGCITWPFEFILCNNLLLLKIIKNFHFIVSSNVAGFFY